MRTLYLLRHAKSSWDDPTLPDDKRPLAPRGRRDGKRIAEHLRRQEIEPELVLCSSAARTRETLELLRPALGGATVVVEDELYGASADRLLARIRLVPDEAESVMVIGHNPGLHELALVLASDRRRARAARGEVSDGGARNPRARGAMGSGRAGGATLTAYVVPKQLG